MRKISPSAVATLSGAGIVLLAIAALYPVAANGWSARQEWLAQAQDFTVASELEQREITRELLLAEIGRPTICDPLGRCPEKPVYFDRTSATRLPLSDVDTDGDWRKYEYRIARDSIDFFDRGDHSVPIALMQRLEGLSRIRFEMSDPNVAGVGYVTDSENFDQVGSPSKCTLQRSPRLIRMSRAAVHQSGNLAVVLIQRIYCEAGGTPRIAHLRRDGAGWHVTNDGFGS